MDSFVKPTFLMLTHGLRSLSLTKGPLFLSLLSSLPFFLQTTSKLTLILAYAKNFLNDSYSFPIEKLFL